MDRAPVDGVATTNVAVLFTDMVGSTELASRLSPESADEVRRGHFSILRQAVSEHGGIEVKNLGDGLMVVFDSASAALSCAVAMQQGVDRDNRAHNRRVGLRVGLSQGEVATEDGDFFGDPVIEAARLCASCDGGQILAADVVRLMAGRRNRHECTAVGELALKGLPDPVVAVEVRWEPLDASASGAAVPLPGRLGLPPAVGLVGRDTELVVIAEAIERASSGEGREVVLVSGEAGLGKTTLVAASARAAFHAGAGVLFGHCEEDLATPYQLFAEALGHYVTHAPDEQLVRHVEVHGGELARLVPQLARRIPDLPAPRTTDAETERYLLFTSVVGLLAQIGDDRQVVLVFDDLQWADPASLALLRHVVGSDQLTRLVVIGTYRDNELSRTHPLLDTLAALHRQTGVSRLDLTGLDDAAVVAYLEAAAGSVLDDTGVGLAHAVRRETDGNPFFVSEVLRHLAETGAVSRDATGRWVAADTLEGMALPDSVREVIGARVGRLGEAAGQILSLAAVIGRDFDLDLLTLATASSEDDLLDVLDAAVGAALVREQADAGRYSFAHALIQHTLYDDLGPNRRARAHRRLAESLEQLCGGRPGPRVGELARHWTAATQPIDIDRAIAYSRQAGDAALASLAPGDALRYYTQAVELLDRVDDPDPALGIDLAIGVGTAQHLTGDPASRETLLDAARRAAERGDTDRLVAAALANDRGWTTAMGAIDTEKIDVLQTCLDRLPPGHPDRALVLASLCAEVMQTAPLEHRRALADEAIAIAESSRDDAVIVRVLNHVFLPLVVPSALDRALTRSADALAAAERLGDPALLFFAAVSRLDAATRAGDIAEKDRCLAIGEAMVERLGQPTMRWMQTFHTAQRALLAGDTDRAEALATEALQIGTDHGVPDAGVFYGGQLLEVAWQRGTLGELIPFIVELDAETPDTHSSGHQSAMAFAYADAGRHELARDRLDSFAGSGFQVFEDHVWFVFMAYLAEAAIECGDPRYAGPLFDQLLPFATNWACTGATIEGPVSHYLGGLATVLGRFDEADTFLTRSAAACAQTGAVFFAARTDLQRGRMLAARGRPGDAGRARDLLTRTLG
ncbi:MAG: AAA family ATPase, partial [Acidimicrobiales bacterium]|nr:AAA family ATPase [Acidimicrobiales bacterium]